MKIIAKYLGAACGKFQEDRFSSFLQPFFPMNRTLFFLPLLLLVLQSGSGYSQKLNKTQTATPKRGEWMSLLKGNSLNQWEMYNQQELKGWQLINGELHSSGAGWDANEDIITKQSFTNFELSLEWKIAPANSSGIFYYVQKGSKHPIYESAPEYQVMDDKGWPQKMKPNQYTSGMYAMYAPEGAKLKPVGEWNSTRILVRYPHVEHWLNGVKVLTYEFGSKDWNDRKASGKWAEVPHYGVAKSGPIGLQNAGKAVYRNIRIREL